MPISSQSWQDLNKHAEMMRKVELKNLYHQPHRFEHFSKQYDGLCFDFSRHLCNHETLEIFARLADEFKLAEGLTDLQNGAAVNTTENRAAWHSVLRRPREAMPEEVQIVFAQMQAFCQRAHMQEWLGFSGKPIRHVVNIGIGGSHLGPEMACMALQPYQQGAIQCHFVANMDAADLVLTLKNLPPDETAFLIASKTFTTDETMTNAQSASAWLQKAAAGKSFEQHFIAVTANKEAALAFGVPEQQLFTIWDWVGGRYSVWSAIGLSIALSVGFENFLAFGAGACAIDQHVLQEDWKNNIPFIMAALGIWYRNFFGRSSHAVLVYEHLLSQFVPYLQQLEMESNGKSIDRDGKPLVVETAPIIWGGCGTNGQHAYHQWLHQGTSWAPVDFIVGASSHFRQSDHHLKLVANCFAQAQALLMGESGANLLPHQILQGNRPSSLLMYPLLTPYVLGQLIALYEYKVFLQGRIWNINSFDQWGVEFGKKLACENLQQFSEPDAAVGQLGNILLLFRHVLKEQPAKR